MTTSQPNVDENVRAYGGKDFCKFSSRSRIGEQHKFREDLPQSDGAVVRANQVGVGKSTQFPSKSTTRYDRNCGKVQRQNNRLKFEHEYEVTKN